MNQQEKKEAINELIETLSRAMAKESGSTIINTLLTDEERHMIILRSFRSKMDETSRAEFETMLTREIRDMAFKMAAQLMEDQKTTFEKMAEGALRSALNAEAQHALHRVLQKAKIDGTLTLSVG